MSFVTNLYIVIDICSGIFCFRHFNTWIRFFTFFIHSNMISFAISTKISLFFLSLSREVNATKSMKAKKWENCLLHCTLLFNSSFSKSPFEYVYAFPLSHFVFGQIDERASARKKKIARIRLLLLLLYCCSLLRYTKRARYYFVDLSNI